MRSILSILLLGTGYGFLAWAAQRYVLYPGEHMQLAGSRPHVPGMEVLWLPTEVGEVEAWYLPPLRQAVAPAPVILFAHGNGEVIDDWPGAFTPVREGGYGVLLVEYPGYGRSPGSCSQETITATMVAAYDRLCERTDVDPKRIVGYGRSLGGGAVAALSRERDLAALVLQSTFTSVTDLARRYLVPGFLVRDPFDNQSAVASFDGPVLIVHGRNDEMIPFAHAEKLHAAAPSSRLLADDSGHNDCPRDWNRVWHAVGKLLPPP